MNSTNRRQVLRTFAVGGGAPLLLLGSKAVTVGSGSHVYEFEKDWGSLPATVSWGFTHGVAVDSKGRVIIHNTSKDAVVIFDAKGKFIKSWGSEYEGGAHGLTLAKEGSDEFLYLADTKRSVVVKTTLDGKEVLRLPYPKTETDVYDQADKAKRYVPTNVAVTRNGDIYVADGYGQSWIHRYNKKGEQIQSWGGRGKEAGKMNSPHGIWVDARSGTEEILVADRTNRRLQYFSPDGKHLRFVTDELRLPCHFDIRGEELLIPDLHGRVTLFDKNNKLITHLGDNPEIWTVKPWPNFEAAQFQPGKFSSPHSACFDKKGNIFVVEWTKAGRVTKLKRVS